MRRVINLLLIAIIAMPAACHADDNTAEKLISLVNMKPAEATQNEISVLLGKPEKVEGSKKQTVWYYTKGSTNLTLYWDNRDESLEKYAYEAVPEKKTWDNNFAQGLRTGQTNLAQALKKLGIPKEMIVRPVNQELHYAYQNTVLHLFFRKGTLVNYTLY